MNLIAFPTFAVISGDTILNALVALAIWGLILWILYWALVKIAPPEPFAKIGMVILVLLTVVVLINILLSMDGRAFIKW